MDISEVLKVPPLLVLLLRLLPVSPLDPLLPLCPLRGPRVLGRFLENIVDRNSLSVLRHQVEM